VAARRTASAIQEREPEKPKAAASAAAAGAAAAAGGEAEVLSESKIRAKRMRAEREAKAYLDRGEPVPQEILDRIEYYKNLKPGQPAAAPGAAAGTGAPAGEVLSGTNPDGTMRFPPGIGIGPKGDPNSYEKVRARRMRAERQFKELTEKGEPIPEELAKTLYELGSDLAPGGSIWQTLAAQGGGAAAAAPAAGSAAGAAKGGAWTPPPGVGTGPKGDPNSFEKVRARRMRAERRAREALAKGEPIPEDVIQTIKELGGTLPEGVE